MTKQPEPKGKLDTEAAATTVDRASANGPEDGFLDWTSVDWQKAEEDVRRLRQRIFTASPAGDLKKVRNLQKLMLRSRANALMSVRRVTEINAGRKTAGIDGRLALLPTSTERPTAGSKHPALAQAAARTVRPMRGLPALRRPRAQHPR